MGRRPTRGNETTAQRVTGYSGSTPQLQTVRTAQYDTLGRVTDQWDAKGTRIKHTDYTPGTGGPLTATKETTPAGTLSPPSWSPTGASTRPVSTRTTGEPRWPTTDSAG